MPPSSVSTPCWPPSPSPSPSFIVLPIGPVAPGDYQWDDEAIYCSELIIKAFAEARDALEQREINRGHAASS
mgnify:CR=1 FL=1